MFGKLNYKKKESLYAIYTCYSSFICFLCSKTPIIWISVNFKLPMRERTFSKPQVKSDTGKINNLHNMIIKLFKKLVI